MQKPGEILAWIGTGILGAFVLAWAFPRVFPFHQFDWQISKPEATAMALERLHDLGEPVASPYVVTTLSPNPGLERRLLLSLPVKAGGGTESSRLARQVTLWTVTIYSRGAAPNQWTYRAQITTGGEVTSLEMRLPEEEGVGPSLPIEEAAPRAARFLAEQGFDLTQLSEPVVRRKEGLVRTDLFLRYRDLEASLGEDFPYGVEVSFAGDRLSGFTPWFEDPDPSEIQEPLRLFNFVSYGWIFVIFPLLPFVSVVFVRRYHEGVIGVERGVQLFLLVLGAACLAVILTVRGITEGSSIGPLTRQQVSWFWGSLEIFIYYPALAALAFFGWSVGESFCRRRWGYKLAAFDALFQGQWTNATVATSALRGVVAGVVLAGLMVAGVLPLGELGAWCQQSFLFDRWAMARWPGVILLLQLLVPTLSFGMFGRLLLLPPAVNRLGPWFGGALVAVFTGLILAPPLFVLPIAWGLPLGVILAGALVALFLAYDLLTTLLAALVSQVLVSGFPLLLAQDPYLQLQGWIAVLGAAAPLLVSLRFLGRGGELTYRYDDIPPHVRRIAERERHRVELETARQIQSSILPQLPSMLAGVEIAHTYQPASEVGGDFYDVLVLEDGRLAVAIGDVAGHGVSSGLVMSMTHSALAVQVSFQPQVEEVFQTLNRMVYQSAHKRLLTTLCYAVLDPERRELAYASAGHLFPYQVSPNGHVSVLESVAYPLGVRKNLKIEPRSIRLEPGDSLFLSSDGLVEARPWGADEPFGFQRLEESLARHAENGARSLQNGVLADVQRFVRNEPQEDDLTVLVLKLP